LNFLVDENMPRSLAPQIAAMGFTVADVRDIGLRGLPDSEVYNAAIAMDAIIITRDRGFVIEKSWPADFTAGVIFVNLPDSTTGDVINANIAELLRSRLPVSLLGAVTVVELRRALSRIVRRRD
jgi:predicted nuclease of predicted toxin-antitoxin system